MATVAVTSVVATRRGKELLVPRSAALPACCIKCGQPAEKPWRKKFYWHPPWVFVLVLLNLLIYLIVAMIIRKNMELNVPLCDRHHGDRKRYILLAILMIIGFIPIGMIFGMYVSEPLGWVTGSLMFIASIVFYSLSGLGFRPAKIDDSGGVFRGACSAFLNQLPQDM